MVAMMVIGAECGVDISCRFYEEINSFISCKYNPGVFYTSMKPKYNILTGVPKKFYRWHTRYFYVKINEALVSDVNKKYRERWSSIIVIQLDHYSRLCSLTTSTRFASSLIQRGQIFVKNVQGEVSLESVKVISILFTLEPIKRLADAAP